MLSKEGLQGFSPRLLDVATRDNKSFRSLVVEGLHGLPPANTHVTCCLEARTKEERPAQSLALVNEEWWMTNAWIM